MILLLCQVPYRGIALLIFPRDLHKDVDGKLDLRPLNHDFRKFGRLELKGSNSPL